MFNFFKKVPIFHMASMARCGETVLLRSLDSHPQIHVVHNLKEIDTSEENKLFCFLKNNSVQYLRITHRLLKKLQLEPNSILLLKQGFWEHKFPFKGFILSRNPVSIYASLRIYDIKQLGNNLDKNWYKNEERLLRWLEDLDPALKINFTNKSPVDQFCIFYNRRMGALFETGLPIVYYEQFITNIDKILNDIVSVLGVSFDEGMPHAHTLYEKGQIGHGNTCLNKPVDSSSLKKYQNIITHEEFDRIIETTKEVACNQYKYNFNWDEITIDI